MFEEKIIWWLKGEEFQNFGDALTSILAQKLFLTNASEGYDAISYQLLGSAIEYWALEGLFQKFPDAGEKKHILWGCGMRNQHAPIPEQMAKIHLLGVRGPLSIKYLGLPADTPIGDPAFLLPLIYTPKIIPSFLGKTICIPHFNEEKSDEELLNITGSDLILRPKIGNSDFAVYDFIDKIYSAKIVLCGAMHGAIVACAYNRPFGFFDSGYLDVSFKWRDFAASVNISACFVDNIKDAQIVYENIFKNRINIPNMKPMLDIAPFAIRDEILDKIR